MTGKEMQDLVRAAIDACGSRDSQALLSEVRNASVRFGQNRITQNLDIFKRELTLTVGDGERKATVTSQRIDRDALPSIARKAEALLENSAPDPEYMPPVDTGQEYPLIEGSWDPDTAACPSKKRLEAVGRVIDTAESHGCETAGIATMRSRKRAVATSTGNAAFHRETGSNLSFTMDRGRASSYRDLHGTAWDEMDTESAIAEMVSEVDMDQGATDLEPGSYSLILEPEATLGLLMFLPWIMDARSADEGTSVFSGMEGKEVTGPMVTLSSSFNGAKPAVPFNDQAVPARETVWIDEGVLKHLPCDRFTASRTGRDPLFIPESFDMAGGQRTVDEMVSSVEKGILIRRFWYIRFVDQRSLKLTGMTRDGVFLVEKGRISRPLKDFRWNWRPFDLFRDIQALGVPVRKYWGMFPSVIISPRSFPFTG